MNFESKYLGSHKYTEASDVNDTMIKLSGKSKLRPENFSNEEKFILLWKVTE